MLSLEPRRNAQLLPEQNVGGDAASRRSGAHCGGGGRPRRRRGGGGEGHGRGAWGEGVAAARARSDGWQPALSRTAGEGEAKAAAADG